MHVKIKKHFLKIFISVFAVVSAFIFRGFWNESSNLKSIEDGSKNLFKDISSNLICVDVVRADTTSGDAGCSAGAGACDGCNDGAGCAAGDSSGDSGSGDSSGGGCGSCD